MSGVGVEQLVWNPGDTEVRWLSGAAWVRKAYPEQIQSVVVLADGSGVAVVEHVAEIGSRSAVVFDADGSERFRLPGELDGRPVWYFQMYYVQGVLTVFFGWRAGDWSSPVDESSGQLLAVRESR